MLATLVGGRNAGALQLKVARRTCANGQRVGEGLGVATAEEAQSVGDGIPLIAERWDSGLFQIGDGAAPGDVSAGQPSVFQSHASEEWKYLPL